MEELNVSADAVRRALDKDNRLMAGFHNAYRNSMKNEKNLQSLRIKMGNELQALEAWESNEKMKNIYKSVSQGFLNISGSHSIFVRESIFSLFLIM